MRSSILWLLAIDKGIILPRIVNLCGAFDLLAPLYRIKALLICDPYEYPIQLEFCTAHNLGWPQFLIYIFSPSMQVLSIFMKVG